ncbi:MAG: hypothetical protein EBZ36_07150 [Acidobacteria bacterium]|nr:hypothetical protein [Acidobacteriota bacterium]
MKTRTIRTALFLLAGLWLIAGGQTILAQAPASRTISRDDVFFTVARRLQQISESPVSAIASELDGVIEVVSITLEPDGRSLVTVRERTPSSSSFTNKSTRMRFSPPVVGASLRDWNWVDFEENRKFYPIDKLFPYVKDELTRRKQATAASWKTFIQLIDKQREAGFRAVETAKAVIKSEPPVMANLITLKAGYETAVSDGGTEAIGSYYREVQAQIEAVNGLAETYGDLKANDAYLRLIDGYNESIKTTTAARKDYLQKVEAYNEALLRLPFTLVAYGLGFTKLEAGITDE